MADTGQHSWVAPLRRNIFWGLSQASHSVLCPLTEQCIGCTKLPSDPADSGDETLRGHMSPSEALHPVPGPWPWSCCMVVSVLSMALWLLLSLLSSADRASILQWATHSTAQLMWLGTLWHNDVLRDFSARESHTCKYLCLPLNISSSRNS